MPRGLDPVGVPLPISHNPLNRIESTVPKIEFPTPEEILASWAAWFNEYILPGVITAISNVFSIGAGVVTTIADLATWVALNITSGISAVGNAINQIGDIANGLIVVPISAAVANFLDWWNSITGQAQDTADKVDDTIKSIFDPWFGGTTSTGTVAEVAATMASIKTAISGGFTLETLTTSGTWTRPADTSNILEFWSICIGSGSGGGKGGSASVTPGDGGPAGRYVAQQINPSDLTSTVAYTIATGGAGRTSTGISAPNNGADSSFGSLASSAGASSSSIASLFGYYNADNSSPGAGGNGGSASTTPPSDGSDGGSTPLAAGGAGGAGNTGGAGGAGSAGATASLTGQSRCGGAGGGGGGGTRGAGAQGGLGGNGGFPGGGGGGGGAGNNAGATGGNGGNGGHGVIILLYRMVS